jgi:hypothetical protein
MTEKRVGLSGIFLFCFRLLIALTAALVWSYFAETRTGKNFESAIHDGMIRYRGPLASPTDVVVAALDEETLRTL